MGRFHRHDSDVGHGTHDHLHEHDHLHGTPGDGHGHEPGIARDLGDHTAYRTGVQRVEVLEQVFGENDAAAAATRAALAEAGVVGINVMSSPGAGKTAVLARTLAWLQEQGVRTGVVVGDIETALDADRLAGAGAQISLVNTAAGFGGECHLDAPMVARGLRGIDLAGIDVLFVENVGNLVCPAEFDVGVRHRVMVSAVTEGEEKPLKYPVMFRSVDLVLLNKMDLVPHLDVDLDLFRDNVRRVNPDCPILPVSARTGDGLAAWHDWLGNQLARR